MPLLLVLLFLFFMPWLGVILLMVLGLFLLVMIPFGFAAGSFFSAVAKPSQLVAVLLDGKVKRIHAIEHATSHVLAKRGYPGISGEAEKTGFVLRGISDPSLVYDSAREALSLLKQGRRDLAIHPRCGTTLVLVNLFGSVFLLVLLALTGTLGFFTAAVSLVAINLVGPALNQWAQRHVTTDAEVGDLVISGVELRSGVMGFPGASVVMADMVYVSVLNDSGVIEAEVV